MSYFDDNEDYLIYGNSCFHRRRRVIKAEPKKRIATLDDFEDLTCEDASAASDLKPPKKN